jgi:hypothetical protein
MLNHQYSDLGIPAESQFLSELALLICRVRMKACRARCWGHFGHVAGLDSLCSRMQIRRRKGVDLDQPFQRLADAMSRVIDLMAMTRMARMALEGAQRRLDNNPHAMRQRRETQNPEEECHDPTDGIPRPLLQSRLARAKR